jgi:four helix bundle protein
MRWLARFNPIFSGEPHKQAFETAMQPFELSKQFPREERYSLTDQCRRSLRSVCGNLAEEYRRLT